MMFNPLPFCCYRLMCLGRSYLYRVWSAIFCFESCEIETNRKWIFFLNSIVNGFLGMVVVVVVY